MKWTLHPTSTHPSAPQSPQTLTYLHVHVREKVNVVYCPAPSHPNPPNHSNIHHVHVWCDLSTVLQRAKRLRLSKMKHVAVGHMYLHEAFARGNWSQVIRIDGKQKRTNKHVDNYFLGESGMLEPLGGLDVTDLLRNTTCDTPSCFTRKVPAMETSFGIDNTTVKFCADVRCYHHTMVGNTVMFELWTKGRA